MADGGFDPCECIFNHEMAMRRLLSLLRSSQAACTDNECFQDGLPGPGQGDAGQWEPETNAVTYNKWSFSAGSDNFMMMMIGWMLMAAMMYFLRPNSMRNNSTEGKPQGEHWLKFDEPDFEDWPYVCFRSRRQWPGPPRPASKCELDNRAE